MRRIKEESRVTCRRMTELCPSNGWMIQNPLDHWNPDLGGCFDEISRRQPRMIKLRIKAQNNGSIVKTSFKSGPESTISELDYAAINARSDEVFFYVLGIYTVMLM